MSAGWKDEGPCRMLQKPSFVELAALVPAAVPGPSVGTMCLAARLADRAAFAAFDGICPVRRWSCTLG